MITINFAELSHLFPLTWAAENLDTNWPWLYQHWVGGILRDSEVDIIVKNLISVSRADNSIRVITINFAELSHLFPLTYSAENLATTWPWLYQHWVKGILRDSKVDMIVKNLIWTSRADNSIRVINVNFAELSHLFPLT